MKPVNPLFLAPIHSLHRIDGSLAWDSWWYEPNYFRPAHPLADKSKVDRMLAFTIELRSRLRTLAYTTDLQSALLRYGRALDSRDLNDAFLRLWGLLEFLTATTSAPYTVTARRAAFLFAERDYAFQVLSHLANYRNRFVHAGSETEEIESLLYLLKRHVEALLIFHAGNRIGFASIAEAGEFLDMPSDKTALAERIRKLRFASKFRGLT